MEKSYTDLKLEEIEYILVKTTSGGPFVEDVFFLVFAGENYWEIPQSAGDNFLAWLKTLPGINWNQMVRSMSSTDDRIFILYRGGEYPVLSEEREKEMEERLARFLSENFEAPADALEKIAARILERYRDSSRHYHNLEHIQHCLWELDQLPGQGLDKKSIELAIWFHDVVYSPTSKRNELDSANQMKNDLGMYPSKINLEDSYRMIVASPLDGDKHSESIRTFIDIDFSVLGQREIEYMAYVQNVRLEYAEVPAWKYYLHRKRLLKRVMKRGVFLTPYFQKRYEAQAVKNLKAEIAKMPYKLIPF